MGNLGTQPYLTTLNNSEIIPHFVSKTSVPCMTFLKTKKEKNTSQAKTQLALSGFLSLEVWVSSKFTYGAYVDLFLKFPVILIDKCCMADFVSFIFILYSTSAAGRFPVDMIMLTLSRTLYEVTCL